MKELKNKSNRCLHRQGTLHKIHIYLSLFLLQTSEAIQERVWRKKKRKFIRVLRLKEMKKNLKKEVAMAKVWCTQTPLVFVLIWDTQEKLKGEIGFVKKLTHLLTIFVKDAWANSDVKWMILKTYNMSKKFQVNLRNLWFFE